MTGSIGKGEATANSGPWPSFRQATAAAEICLVLAVDVGVVNGNVSRKRERKGICSEVVAWDAWDGFKWGKWSRQKLPREVHGVVEDDVHMVYVPHMSTRTHTHTHTHA